MVDTVINTLKPSPLCLTEDEVAEINDLIDRRELPSDWFERCRDAADANTFGVDAPKDRHGNRQEQGRGSAFNQTQQSVDAYKKWGANEPDYEKNLARMTKELEASNARRAAERAAAPPRRATR